MRASNPDLPYWDGFLEILREQYPGYDREAFHSHYGCWDDPAWSNRRSEDYGRAAERMCQKVCEAAGVRPGSRVLDVGCGLGSVIASLNHALAPIELVGLNVDLRQLRVAVQGVKPRAGNSVSFVAGDAGVLPFADESFDTVLALECTMHFPSRRKFLDEARRLLKPGGRLALCEHFAKEPGREQPDRPQRSELFGAFIEPISVSQFAQMANQAGMQLVSQEDVSRQTVPTFPMVRRMMWRSMKTLRLKIGAWSTLALAETLIRTGLLHYKIVAFETTAGGSR